MKNKQARKMIKSVFSEVYLSCEGCFVDVNWNSVMIPAIEDIVTCNVTLNQYVEWEIIKFGVISLTASEIKGK